MKLSGATRLCGVAGNPVRHSLSPALHNAAYEALGIDWVYLPFEVPSGDFAAAMAGARALGLRGLSVTMPYKEQAAALADRRSLTARRLGAANTLTFENGEVRADSTDGAGLLNDLRDELGYEVEGRSCGVIGAGGAARSVILALAEAGAAEILVVNRTAVRAFKAATLAPAVGRVARPEELAAVELIVQATPFGMGRGGGDDADGEAAWPAGFDPAMLGPGQLALDLVYHPARTRWLARAAETGASTRNGLGMLVHQAAIQVERFTGAAAPTEAMWAAVREPPPTVASAP